MMRLPFRNRILFLVLVLCLATYAQRTPQAESRRTASLTFAPIPTPDFTITATVPSVVPADGTSVAKSTVITNPVNGFTGNITLSESPIPPDLKCTAIDPATIPNGYVNATFSCSSAAPRTYKVTIIGTSGSLSHNATTTFTFTAFASPNFTIIATSSMSFTSGLTATSNVRVNPENGFYSDVILTTTISPDSGLSVSLTPSSIIHGSGTSTTTFISSMPGNYTVTITATGGAIQHTTTVNVHVAAESHAPPAPPSTTPGPSPAVFYGVIGVIIFVVIAGIFLVLRRVRPIRS